MKYYVLHIPSGKLFGPVSEKETAERYINVIPIEKLEYEIVEVSDV